MTAGSRAGAGAALVLIVLLVAGVRLYDDTTAAARVSIVKRFTLADRATGRYQYLPFEVPPGTGALRISYQYDRADGRNVIDLGLFEPGSLELNSRAFRGYSGGARSAITIDPAGATPGYRPGPLPPGRWNLLLGLYRVDEAGVDVTIDIETDAGPAAFGRASPSTGSARASSASLDQRLGASTPARRRRQAVGREREAGGGVPTWVRGALHTHTVHSDGTIGPNELLRMFGNQRFDFVAITDHNNTTHRYDMERQPRSSRSPLWIVGEEVTTPNGHANVLGLDDDEWVDFRVRAEEKRIGELVSAASRYGALFSVNHPASECAGCRWEHDFVQGIDAIEISNGRHAELDRALAIWDGLLTVGRRITGVGSSDWHSAPNAIDLAHVRVYSRLTEPAILTAIREGRVIIMTNIRHATPEITVGAGAKLANVGESLDVNASAPVTIGIAAPDLPRGRADLVANGKRLSPVLLDDRGQARVDRRIEPGYLRFELRAADGTLSSLTNPVHLVRR